MYICEVSRSADIFKSVNEALQSRVANIEALLSDYICDNDDDDEKAEIDALMCELDATIERDRNSHQGSCNIINIECSVSRGSASNCTNC